MTGTRQRPPVYVCDLAGTLIGSGKSLSSIAREALNSLVRAGMQISIASARSTPAMRAMLDGVDIRLPVIELNGVHVSDLGTGRHVVSNVMDAGAAGVAIRAVRDMCGQAFVTAFDGTRDRLYYDPPRSDPSVRYLEEKVWYGDDRLTSCLDLPEVARTEQVGSVVAFVRESEGAAAVGELRKVVGRASVSVVGIAIDWCPGWMELSVQDRSAGKGSAIMAMLDVAGLSGSPLVVAGDHENDLSMFAVADFSVAPSDAHASAIEACSLVVGDCGDDGVVKFLASEHAGRSRAGTPNRC